MMSISQQIMKNYHQKFSFIGLLNSFKNAINGFHVLLRNEYNLYIQLVFAGIAVIAGIIFNISFTEWAIQTIVIGLVIFSELVNTAIEKTMDLVHPEYSDKVCDIKDLAAGTVLFTVGIAVVSAVFIYLPKIL